MTIKAYLTLKFKFHIENILGCILANTHFFVHNKLHKCASKLKLKFSNKNYHNNKIHIETQMMRKETIFKSNVSNSRTMNTLYTQCLLQLNKYMKFDTQLKSKIQNKIFTNE